MKKILIVDDGESIRKVIVTTPMEHGYEALEAEDEIQGFDMAKGEKPDLILTDIYMENMNGFMMAEMLRDPSAAGKLPGFLL